MFRVNCPEQLWEYGYNHVAKIMNQTASNLKGRKSLELVTGEIVDISEYLDFYFYDRVWFMEEAGIGLTKVGRWLGVADGHGSRMNYGFFLHLEYQKSAQQCNKSHAWRQI